MSASRIRARVRGGARRHGEGLDFVEPRDVGKPLAGVVAAQPEAFGHGARPVASPVDHAD